MHDADGAMEEVGCVCACVEESMFEVEEIAHASTYLWTHLFVHRTPPYIFFRAWFSHDALVER